jgi:hypothetical protein
LPPSINPGQLSILKVEDVPPAIGLLGLTNFPYFVTMHAVSRLGYTVFLLSPGLSIDAYCSLLGGPNCKTILYSPVQESVASKLLLTRNVSTLAMPSVQQIDSLPQVGQPSPRFGLNIKSAGYRIAFTLHSSGSTALLKPTFHTYSAIISGMGAGYGGRVLNTCLLFHFHRLGMMHRTMFKRGTTFYPDFSTPLTSLALLSQLEKVRPSAVFAVPYRLTPVAEVERSIEILSKCEVVTFSGSAFSDELGNLLTERGVHLVSICGRYVTHPKYAIVAKLIQRQLRSWSSHDF